MFQVETPGLQSSVEVVEAWSRGADIAQRHRQALELVSAQQGSGVLCIQGLGSLAHLGHEGRALPLVEASPPVDELVSRGHALAGEELSQAVSAALGAGRPVEALGMAQGQQASDHGAFG